MRRYGAVCVMLAPTMTIIYELKCFGIHAGEGNSALVVLGNHGDADGRQRFAAEQQRSACVFVDAPAGGDVSASFVLDYFYPHARSPLCLHATLAAARVLLAQHMESTVPLRVRTALHGQLLTLSRSADGSQVYVALERQHVPAIAVHAELGATLMDRPGLVFVSPPAIASVGSPKLLLEVADSAILQSLAPDLARIAAWSAANGVNGCYAYCRRADGSYEGRNFNHTDARLEDSATGVAAGALTVHLGHALTVYQGANLGQPCVLQTQWRGEQVLIGGRAEFIATLKA